MSDTKKEPWLNHLALTTVIFAVCATLSTFKGGGYSTRSVISQAQASDQWAYFQAKSTKENLYTLEAERLKLMLETLPANTPATVTAHYRELVQQYGIKLAKYRQEKQEIQDKARELEATRDEAQRHSGPFGLAVIFLQVAILISSIAGLMQKKMLWYTALPVGLIGLVYFADGFLLFM